MTTLYWHGLGAKSRLVVILLLQYRHVFQCGRCMHGTGCHSQPMNPGYLQTLIGVAIALCVWLVMKLKLLAGFKNDCKGYHNCMFAGKGKDGLVVCGS